jgi:uncharacterized membrane protein YccC
MRRPNGYTAAIIGIPGALDPNNAFYTASARVTEICLGIIATHHSNVDLGRRWY